MSHELLCVTCSVALKFEICLSYHAVYSVADLGFVGVLALLVTWHHLVKTLFNARFIFVLCITVCCMHDCLGL